MREALEGDRGGETGYYANRFRLVAEKKTDISWAYRIDRKVFGGVDA